MKYIAFGLLFLSAIEAGRSTKKAARTAVIDKRRKEIEKKAKVILDYKNMNHEFAVDTNILMHEPDMLLYLLAKSNLRLFMSMVVFTELDGLKKSENVVTRTQAQTAFDVIEEFQRRGNLHLLQVPKNDELRKYGLGSSPDEKIIGTYLWERERNHPVCYLFPMTKEQGFSLGMPACLSLNFNCIVIFIECYYMPFKSGYIIAFFS